MDTGHSGDLKVTGSVTPKACSINFVTQKPGEISFGDIQPVWTTGNMYKIPAQIDVQTKVACQGGAIPFLLSFIDNKDSTIPVLASTQLPTGSQPFGLGAVGGRNIGAFTVHTSYYGNQYTDATGAHNSDPTITNDGGATWTNVPGGAGTFVKTGDFYVGWHTRGLAGDAPVAAKEAIIFLSFNAYLNEENAFPQGAKINLDGLMTVKISYLD